VLFFKLKFEALFLHYSPAVLGDVMLGEATYQYFGG